MKRPRDMAGSVVAVMDVSRRGAAWGRGTPSRTGTGGLARGLIPTHHCDAEWGGSLAGSGQWNSERGGQTGTMMASLASNYRRHRVDVEPFLPQLLSRAVGDVHMVVAVWGRG